MIYLFFFSDEKGKGGSSLQSTEATKPLKSSHHHQHQRARTSPETKLIKVFPDVTLSTCFVNACSLSYAYRTHAVSANDVILIFIKINLYSKTIT